MFFYVSLALVAKENCCMYGFARRQARPRLCCHHLFFFKIEEAFFGPV
jgi:hypothetical protein